MCAPATQTPPFNAPSASAEKNAQSSFMLISLRAEDLIVLNDAVGRC